jgi:hypothetical protein
MNTLKPNRRIKQAATQVKVLSPVMSIVTKVDAFHGVGRQHLCPRNWQEGMSFVGVLVRGMLEDGLDVNLGDPHCSFLADAGEYRSTSLKRQGDWNGNVEVGFARSTPSAGKLQTWGRGKRGEASVRGSVFTLHRGWL